MSLSPMFQLFEIQCAQKLRVRSMDFLWVGASILLDIVNSLVPFLTELLLPKKSLIMNSLPNPRSAALALVLPPMPIYLDLRTNYFHGTGCLRSAYIESKNSCELSKLMKLLVFVMKWLLSSLVSSSLLPVSRQLHFVNPVIWHVLSTIHLKPTN